MSNRRSFLKSLGLGAAGAATVAVAGGSITRTEAATPENRTRLPLLKFVNLPSNMRIRVRNAQTHAGLPFYVEELDKSTLEMTLRAWPDTDGEVEVIVSERENFRSGEASMLFTPERGKTYVFDYKDRGDNGSWRD